MKIFKIMYINILCQRRKQINLHTIIILQICMKHLLFSPTSSSLQKQVHAVRHYRQMDRLTNIIFGSWRANAIPTPKFQQLPHPPNYQCTYYTVIRALILRNFFIHPSFGWTVSLMIIIYDNHIWSMNLLLHKWMVEPWTCKSTFRSSGSFGSS